MVKTLIIAAGRGKRFRPYTDRQPKPLIPLLGAPLIERVILNVKEAGIREIVIVTGYMGGKLRRFLNDGLKYGVEIEYAENEDWRLGNGFSVYAARRLIDGNFILLMADHIFNPKILSDLQECRLHKDECILCVDTNMRYVFDIDDATKVHTDGKRILKIGKKLTDYNGVDMGIFLCTPSIFSALERTINRGCYSLTDAVSLLASKRKMTARIFDDEEYYWFDVDTPLIRRIVEKILPVVENVEASHERILTSF
jgi:choline kinase